MFVFFKNDVFFSFWGNNKGEEFFSATCKGLKWNPIDIDLYWYDVDSTPEFFNFDENKNLLILEKKKREILNEETNEVKIETYFDTVAQYTAEKYVEKGSIIISC